mgnify:CR=1 FL=1
MVFFNRHILTELENWKNSNTRKPLILRGARQVGKTTIVKQFSENYTNSIFLNLEKSSDKLYFDTSDNIKNIVETIFLDKSLSLLASVIVWLFALFVVYLYVRQQK